jgi:hypothetical protein
LRIEFYRLNTDPSKLCWDVTHANYSAITERKSRAYTEVDGEIIGDRSGFFLDPKRVSRKTFPTIPATHESVMTWLMRSGFFSPVWVLKILLGNEETLREACTQLTGNFHSNLRGFLVKSERSDVENYLESLRVEKADEKFRDMAREQAGDIANYQAKYLPRMVDSE